MKAEKPKAIHLLKFIKWIRQSGFEYTDLGYWRKPEQVFSTMLEEKELINKYLKENYDK